LEYKPRFQVGRIDVPVDWDSYVGNWSRNRRKKQGQLERQLQRQGDVAFVDVDVSTKSAWLRPGTSVCDRTYRMERPTRVFHFQRAIRAMFL
jgi:hypothetical protein